MCTHTHTYVFAHSQLPLLQQVRGIRLPFDLPTSGPLGFPGALAHRCPIISPTGRWTEALLLQRTGVIYLLGLLLAAFAAWQRGNQPGPAQGPTALELVVPPVSPPRPRGSAQGSAWDQVPALQEEALQKEPLEGPVWSFRAPG